MPRLTIDTNLDSPAEVRLSVRYLQDLLALKDTTINSPCEPVVLIPDEPPIVEDQEEPEAAHVPTMKEVLAAEGLSLAAPHVPAGTTISIGTLLSTLVVPGADGSAEPKYTFDPVVAPREVPAVDSECMPWDARIHSESKTLVKNGTWKARRNVSPDTVSAVRAELKARTLAVAPPYPVAQHAVAPPPPALVPPPPAAVPPPPLALVPPPPTVAPPPPPVMVLPPPTAPVAPVASGVPAQPDAGTVTFRQLMTRINMLVAENKLTTDQAIQVARDTAQVQSLQGLIAQPDRLPLVWAALERYA